MVETQTLVEKLRELDFTFESQHVDFDNQMTAYRQVIDEYSGNPLVAQAITKGPKRVKFHKVVSDIVDQPTKEQVEAMGLEVIFNDAIQKLGFPKKDYKPLLAGAAGVALMTVVGVPLLLGGPVGGLVGYFIVKESRKLKAKRLQEAKEELKADALYLDSKIRQVYKV